MLLWQIWGDDLWQLYHKVTFDGYNKLIIVNAGEDALITIGCDKCGATQQHTLDLEEIIFNLQMEWQE